MYHVLALAAGACALVAPVPARPAAGPRSRVVVNENFGLNFAEDQSENTPFAILGERRLKTEFVKSYKPTASVLEGKPYPVFQEVQEKRLLSATADSGLLGALDDMGLTLSDVERLLPQLDKSRILGLVSKNLPLAVIAVGYLLIEPAPFLLPVLGAALRVNGAIWAAVAALALVSEVGLVATDGSFVTELLLAPLLLVAAVLAAVPQLVASLKSLPPVE